MSETTVLCPPRQRKKVARFCRVTRDADGCRTLTLRVGKQVDAYDLHEIATDYGRGFELTKPDGTIYHVCLDGLCSTCDCKGCTKFGHCKHLDALVALDLRGRV